MSKDTPTEAQKDKLFFNQKMADVHPLKKKSVLFHSLPKQSPASKPPVQAAQQHPLPSLTAPPTQTHKLRLFPPNEKKDPPLETPTVNEADILFFKRGGLQNKPAHQLQRGRLPIECTLDLHGMTTQQAQNTLEQALNQAYHSQKRVIHIIHGKGLRNTTAQKPILKNWLNHWLRHQVKVMAFCSAQPQDGGTGAVYVLLKRRRQ